MQDKIIQIIPAPFPMWAQFDVEGGENEKYIAPVVCLALVEDGVSGQEVRPMCIDVDGCVDFANDICAGFERMLFEEGEK